MELYVKLTESQALQVAKHPRTDRNPIGVTSGKKDKTTGKRPVIKFCSALNFARTFGYEVEREFIEI